MCKHELSQAQTEESIEVTSQYTTKYPSRFTFWPSLKGKHIKAWMMPFTRISEHVLHFQLCRNRAMTWANFPPPALKFCFGTTDTDSGRQQGWGSPPWEKGSALVLACAVLHHTMTFVLLTSKQQCEQSFTVHSLLDALCLKICDW